MTETQIPYKGWTIERRLWAIHWLVMIIGLSQTLGILAILLVLAR